MRNSLRTLLLLVSLFLAKWSHATLPTGVEANLRLVSESVAHASQIDCDNDGIRDACED